MFRYLTTNGLEREETGIVDEIHGTLLFRVTGYYSYVDTNGKLLKMFYKADENGYTIEDTAISTDKSPEIASALTASLAGGGLGK